MSPTRPPSPVVVDYYRPAKPDGHMLRGYAAELAKTKMITNGPLCREFENTVKDFQNTRYALACSNATDGLTIALKAAKKLTGAKECVMPSFTWMSCPWAAENAGLRVMYGDCDLNTWMLGPIDRKKEIIMPVSVFGSYVDPKMYDGNIIIDAAHSLGVPIETSKSLGAVISFAPSKLLTCGEGGMFITDDSRMAAEFAAMRDKFARMTEMNAAMGLSHWGGLSAYMRDRKNRWQKYKDAMPCTPQAVKRSNYSTAAFRIKNRDAVAEELKKRGVESRAYYQPLHKGLPATDKLFSEIICLPSWWGCPTDAVLKALSEIYS